jgi:cytochrome c oxidase cbb3-type subunit I
LFWFPWIYSTANLSLALFPVRGMAQAVIAWWYSHNLYTIWLGFIGLGILFYFIPTLSQRPLHSYYLALLAFWLLMLFGSWGGIPGRAPVPAWLPALSGAAAMLTLVPILAIGLNLYNTAGRAFACASKNPCLAFLLVGLLGYLLSTLMQIVLALVPTIDLTWFTIAKNQMHYYGFFSLVIFGAVYYIAPQLTGIEFPSAKRVRLHYYLALSGLFFSILPLAAGGLIQGLRLNDARVPFLQITKGTLMFLRISTLGDLLLIAANVLFLMNLLQLASKLYRARAAAAYVAVTSEIKPVEART